MNIAAIRIEAEPLAGDRRNCWIYLDDLNRCICMAEHVAHRRIARPEPDVQDRLRSWLIEIG